MEKALVENVFKDGREAVKDIQAKRYKHEPETKTQQHCALGMGKTLVRQSQDLREGMRGGHLGMSLRKAFI